MSMLRGLLTCSHFHRQNYYIYIIMYGEQLPQEECMTIIPHYIEKHYTIFFLIILGNQGTEDSYLNKNSKFAACKKKFGKFLLI